MDDQWVARIKKSLDDEVEATAKRLGSGGISLVPSFANQVDEKLADAIFEAVAAELPEAKRPWLNAYRQETLELRKLEDEIAIDGVLVFLDSKLCFSEKQLSDIRQRYLQAWDSRLNGAGAMTAMNGLVGGRSVVEVLDLDVWEEILRPLQLDEFKKLGQSFWLIMANNFSEASDFKKLCDTAIEMKLAEYDAMFDISKKQAKVLSIAKKGASMRAQRRLEELGQLLASDPKRFAKGAWMVEESGSIVSKCAQEPVWEKTLAKVFDREQLAAIKRRENSRNALVKKQLVNFMVLSLAKDELDVRLNLNQHKKLVGLIEKAIVPSNSNFGAVLKGICAVSDKEFQQVITLKQWESIRPMIEEIRKMGQPKGEAEAAENETADAPDDD